MLQLVGVKGLAATPPEFRKRLVEVSHTLGVDPNYLATVISFESAGTFSPSIKNPGSSATGLIQFMASTAKGLGTSVEALAAMTATEQLVYVQKYFEIAAKGKNLSRLRDVYLTVFAPGFVNKGDDAPAYIKGQGGAYEVNAAMDRDGDGIITVGDVGGVIEGVYQGGLKNPPVEVLDVPIESEGGDTIAFFLLTLLSLGIWRWRARKG